MKLTTLAATAATAAAAAAPATPTWPKEFTTELTLVDFRNKFNTSSDQAYSTSNAAILDDYSRFGHNGTSLQDWKTGIAYEAMDGHCREHPIRGTIPAPPVNTFIFNGTVTFPDGKQAYRYTEPQFRDQEYFTTPDVNQYPIAFYDYRQEMAQEFRNFKPITAWPANTFSKPAGCQ